MADDVDKSYAAARRIYEDWHTATLAKDLDGLAALYAKDAVFETPGALLASDGKDGVVVGREAIRAYLALFFEKLGDSVGKWYRTDSWFTNGEQLIWEYPRETPDGDQPGIIEVMELDAAGLIAMHRVYWSWFGIKNSFEPRASG